MVRTSPDNTKKCYSWNNDTLILDVRVQAGAKRDRILGTYNRRLKVRIAAPPVNGKANKQLLKFLAHEFGVHRNWIRILSGETNRDKRLSIESPQKLPEMISRP